MRHAFALVPGVLDLELAQLPSRRSAWNMRSSTASLCEVDAAPDALQYKFYKPAYM